MCSTHDETPLAPARCRHPLAVPHRDGAECRPRGRAGAARQALRPRLLESRHRVLRARWRVPLRQPPVERDLTSSTSSRSSLAASKIKRVYLGVGPEQNFTYIAALKPKMVFIVDIRRGNLQLHLMYKALFELAADRADFIFRLFSRKRPEGLGAKSTAGRDLRRPAEGGARAGRAGATLCFKAESQGPAGPPDAHASPAADRRRT